MNEFGRIHAAHFAALDAPERGDVLRIFRILSGEPPEFVAGHASTPPAQAPHAGDASAPGAPNADAKNPEAD